MVTTRSVPVCYLWESMTSFERALFMQCIASTTDTRLIAGNVDVETRSTSYDMHGVMTTATIESAKQFIADALCDDNGDTQNLLVKLVNNNEAKLAMKLLTKMAASDGWRSFVQRSLDAECFGGGTLLHEAAKYGCISELNEFITTDLLSNLRPNDNGDTPLHLAAAYGHEKDVEVLLEKPVVITRNKKGWTALHYAVSHTTPSVSIVSSLIQYIFVHDPLALDAQSDEYKNTAFHLACRNKVADEKLLKCFKEADPMICNTDRQTPLHLAAEREHDPQPIAVLLGLFLPQISRNNLAVNFDIDCNGTQLQHKTSNALDVHSQIVFINEEMSSHSVCDNDQPQRQQTFYFSGKSLVDTLLRLCAKNGHRDAVALLLHNGADPKNVLHDIVDESVKRPDKIKDLLAVYKAIVENVIVPDSRWVVDYETDNNTVRGLNNYNETRRRRVIDLVEEPNNFGKNVIERAIEAGAKDLLLAILNSPNVFRFDEVSKASNISGADLGDMIHYDVTNMVHSTRSRQKTSSDGTSTRRVYRTAKSYMELITEHDSIWREHDILRMEPFKQLSKAYVGFMRRFDLFAGVIHLAYMCWLSYNYLPDKCSLNEHFQLNSNGCNTTVDGYFNRHFSQLWYLIIWPVVILVVQLYAFISYMEIVCKTATHLKREQYDEVQNVSGASRVCWRKLLYKVIDKLPFYAYSAMSFYWLWNSTTRSPVSNYYRYLEVTSMMFLFGWMINFVLFCRIKKETYVLSLVLKSVMIEDILFNFAPVFLLSVIAFTCTFYVLQMTVIDSVMSFGDTFYEMFATAFSVTDDLYKYTSDPMYNIEGGNSHSLFLKAVYIAYLSLTVLILFSYLIAMMTHRYEKEIPHAKNAWRFDCVSDVMQLEKRHFASEMSKWMHQTNNCCRDGRNPININFGDRHFITVPRWRPWLKDSIDDD